MSYPWHMAFSGILVNTALEFRTSMHSLSLLYHSFWIFQPVSLVNNRFSISLHDQRCHPACHDHMEQARGDLLENYPPPIWATPKDQCLPQVDSGGNCNLPVCVGLPRGALSEHWRRTTSLAHCELSMLRESAHYNTIPRTPDMLLFAESLHGKWVPHLLHLRHQPHLPSLQRPGGVIQVFITQQK